MKRLLLILVVCAALTSCRWIHETFYPVDSCAEWYAEKLYKAAANDDVDEFIEVGLDYEKWYKSLDNADKKKAQHAVEKWMQNNASQVTYEGFINKHESELERALND